jgi:CheY-like chemotaxis protein
MRTSDKLKTAPGGLSTGNRNLLVPPPELPRATSKLAVLIAEDSPAQQEAALAILAELGCRGEAVANGAEALLALRKADYDLVLMDCQMPEMDGYEATRQIRGGSAGVRNPAIPIIAVTANTSAEDRETCFASGMTAFLAKPLQVAALAALLADWNMSPWRLSVTI